MYLPPRAEIHRPQTQRAHLNAGRGRKETVTAQIGLRGWSNRKHCGLDWFTGSKGLQCLGYRERKREREMVVMNEEGFLILIAVGLDAGKLIDCRVSGLHSRHRYLIRHLSLVITW